MTEIIRKRGDTYANEFIIKDSAGTVIDITGYSFTLTVDPQKNPTDDSNNLFQLAGNITDGPNGAVEFAPSAVQADQEPGTYYYDLQMTDLSGAIRTVALDKYKFVQDITK